MPCTSTNECRQDLPIADAQTKYPIDLPRGILELLVLTLAPQHILFRQSADTEADAAVSLRCSGLLVCFNGEDTEVPAGVIEAGDSPGTEEIGLILTVEHIDHLSPSLVYSRPIGLVCIAHSLRFFCCQKYPEESPVYSKDFLPCERFFLVEMEIGIVLQLVAEVGGEAVGVGRAVEVIQPLGIVWGWNW